jgi:lysyl-tRNA synthetase class 2
MFLTDNASIQEVLFFPQMRPEKKEPAIELSEDEKTVLNLLGEEQISLAQVKEQSGLSGKKWDTATKNLRQKDLIQIIVEGDNKLILRNQKG